MDGDTGHSRAEARCVLKDPRGGDPPRPEARQAIAECRDAGIRVRMITGDHAVTAGVIASELGIPGPAVSGTDLDQIDDDDLGRRLGGIGVVARVSPAHKLRIVRALLASTVMAAGTLAVLVWAPGPEPHPGEATIAATMAFVTFVFFQSFTLLNVRHHTRSVFSRETLQNSSAFVAIAVVVVMLILVVEVGALNTFFTTTNLTSGKAHMFASTCAQECRNCTGSSGRGQAVVTASTGGGRWLAAARCCAQRRPPHGHDGRRAWSTWSAR
jgi:magnesium-transporting ATPase (P-type)